MTDEVWKPVVGFSWYEVSSKGSVRSIDKVVSHLGRGGCEVTRTIKGRLLSVHTFSGGYRRACLTSDDSVESLKLVHRLMAEAFIENPEAKLYVNHMNGVRDDNRIENLEWVTASENVRHGFRSNGRIHPQLGKTGSNNHGSIAVIGESQDGRQVRFVSMLEAGQHGFNPAAICNCIAGRNKQHRQMTWRKAEPKKEVL